MHKRETELDILRILALLAVIFTHACGVGTGTSEQRIISFLSAVVTWHVPVYVMLSGRFFLDPDRQMPMCKLVKAIWRLVLAFLVWNAVYQVFYICSGTYSGLNWKGILSQVLIGPYHFWYLYMLVGLYAVTPFLRKIVQDKKLAEYFLLLFFVFSALTQYGPRLPLIGTTVDQILNKIQFHLALGYSGYYILGYYLKKYPLSGKKEMGLYVAGIMMLLVTGGATVWNTLRGAEGKEWFSKYLMPNVIIEAAAIFSFFVNRVSKMNIGDCAARWIIRLSEHSFGIYLIHALVLDVISVRIAGAWENIHFALIFAVLLATFGVSLLLVSLLRKMPYFGKRIA